MSVLSVIELVKEIFFSIDQLLQFWGQLASAESLTGGVRKGFLSGVIVPRMLLVPAIPEHDAPRSFVPFLGLFLVALDKRSVEMAPARNWKQEK